MRINICPSAMLCQLNVSAQSKDHVSWLLGSSSQSHTGLFPVLEIIIKCSETPAWRVLAAKYHWDRLTFFKSLRDSPQNKEIVRPGFSPCLNRTEKPALHYADTLPLTEVVLHGHTTMERLCIPALTIFWALWDPWNFTGILLPKYFWKWGFFNCTIAFLMPKTSGKGKSWQKKH